MEGMDGCSWETGSKGVISYVRGQLLAAFQDLKTITNEIEVHTRDNIKKSAGTIMFFFFH